VLGKRKRRKVGSGEGQLEEIWYRSGKLLSIRTTGPSHEQKTDHDDNNEEGKDADHDPDDDRIREGVGAGGRGRLR